MSALGLYFETDQFFFVGEVVNLAVRLDASDSINGWGIGCVRCKGEVRRVDSILGKTGVAVSFDSYSFEPKAGTT